VTSEIASTERGRRKTLVGIVVSVKMDKTAVVSVEERKPHPLYRKIVRSTKRYKAHDPNNAAVLGDVVRIEETRPISKQKRWRIAQTLTRGNVADIAPRDIGVPEEALATPAPPPAPVAPATEIAADVAEETTAAASTSKPEAAEPAGATELGSDVAAATEATPPGADSPDDAEMSADEAESPDSPESEDEAESPDSPEAENGEEKRA
jgi:small subunit ribosomal protein S17